MKAAANLSMLWADLPYLDRFDAAAAAGFRGVEVLFPYEWSAKDTLAALGRNRLELILINAPPPNYTGGPRGFAAQPEQTARFQSDMRRAFRFAQALGVGMVHVMAGRAEGRQAHDTMVRNMRWAAQAAPKGITLMLEPLCPQAMPDYFLNDYAQAHALIDEIDAPNVALQFDSFHAQMIHGDAAAVFADYAHLIRHIQISDAPDRGTPGTGAVDFGQLLETCKTAGYKGWVSGEYTPDGPTEKTLDWVDLL